MSLEEEKVSTESTGAAVRIRGISAFDVEVDHRHPELQRQIDELRTTLERLIFEVNNIRNLLEVSPVRVRIIETREVSMEEAKRLILEYMGAHDIAYPDDIADELGLDLKVAIEAVSELITEGKIKESREE